ncbi:hypothetical protein [Gemella sp. zg-570]|nr:hypothetical protein [Gemella sp. zg-570]
MTIIYLIIIGLLLIFLFILKYVMKINDNIEKIIKKLEKDDK